VRRSHRQSGEFGEDGRAAQAKAAQERRQAKKTEAKRRRRKRKWTAEEANEEVETENGKPNGEGNAGDLFLVVAVLTNKPSTGAGRTADNKVGTRDPKRKKMLKWKNNAE